ncbi:MAG: hypothetical protein MUC49_14000 [Raineya sp.]|jgi:hypothetical protein|nr:hypothetical protein [Raineya sp.]
MIRVYLDLNILTIIKEPNSFLQDVLDTITRYREDVLVFYSQAHINDLLKSYDGSERNNELIKKDLDFIFEITQGHFWSHYFNEDIKSLLKKPHDVFEEALLTPKVEISSKMFDEALEILKTSLPSNYIKIIDDLINSMMLGFEGVFSDPKISDTMSVLFPGLNEESKFGDFLDSLGKTLRNWDTSKDYDTVRKLLQDSLGYRPDKLFGTGDNDLKDPFKAIDNLLKKNTDGQKGYDDLLGINREYKGKQSPKWHDNITEEYFNLDILGFRSDKIEIHDNPKKKKNVFTNIVEDTNHAVFASLCDIYVTNDKYSKAKVEQVYKKLNIPTKVCFPQHFKVTLEELLFKPKNLQEFVDYMNSCISTKPFSVLQDDGFDRLLFKSTQKIFNFFDIVFFEKYGGTQLLGCYRTFEKSEDSPIVVELNYLVKYLISFLGMDGYSKGELADSEIFEIRDNIWLGREWWYNNKLSIQLKYVNYFTLYILIYE